VTRNRDGHAAARAAGALSPAARAAAVGRRHYLCSTGAIWKAGGPTRREATGRWRS
jgi:hypothetical protein